VEIKNGVNRELPEIREPADVLAGRQNGPAGRRFHLWRRLLFWAYDYNYFRRSFGPLPMAQFHAASGTSLVLKLVPTAVPMTLPMMAPATNSENQWMVTETPKPM
jgi:hypothetical protein